MTKEIEILKYNENDIPAMIASFVFCSLTPSLHPISMHATYMSASGLNSSVRFLAVSV